MAIVGAGNGRLYAPPFCTGRASESVEIDPFAGTARQIGEDLLGENKYEGIVVAGGVTVRQIGDDILGENKYKACCTLAKTTRQGGTRRDYSSNIKTSGEPRITHS